MLLPQACLPTYTQARGLPSMQSVIVRQLLVSHRGLQKSLYINSLGFKQYATTQFSSKLQQHLLLRRGGFVIGEVSNRFQSLICVALCKKQQRPIYYTMRDIQRRELLYLYGAVSVGGREGAPWQQIGGLFGGIWPSASSFTSATLHRVHTQINKFSHKLSTRTPCIQKTPKKNKR